MNVTLKIWRQESFDRPGDYALYEANDISPEMSFLEMLDIVNEQLIATGEVPIEFDHDCREGICGTCSLVIDGIPHGPQRSTATCQLHMRKFEDLSLIHISEPTRHICLSRMPSSA